MSFIDDIFTLMRKGRDMTQDIERLSSMNPKSVASRARESTCVFACIGPDSISTPLMAATTKSMDLVYASFVQTVVASNPLIDITLDRGPLDYMKRLHQNLKIESAVDEKELQKVIDRVADLKFTLESVEKIPVSEDLLTENSGRMYNGDYKVFMDPSGEFGMVVHEASLTGVGLADYKKSMSSPLSHYDTEPFVYTEADKYTSADIAGAIIGGANSTAKSNEIKNQLEIAKNSQAPKILDRDVKRMNDMQPYAISVRLMAVNDKKEFVQYIDFIIGIKTNLHIVKPHEIVSYFGAVLQNRNPVLNFVKWTTGEISFVKDFLLHLDEIKTDVTYKSRGISPWLPKLRRMKNQKIKLSLTGPTKLIPNSTIVISSFEVDDIKRLYGFNVRDIFFAKKVMSELFLMAFIIIDEGSETIDILYEDAGYFETYTLDTLERQVDLSSNKLGKEIGRMISQ